MRAPPPIWIGHVDLDRSPMPCPASRDRHPDDAHARVLVRLHRQIVGVVDVAMINGEIAPDALLNAVRTRLAEPLAHHLALDGLSLGEAVRQHDSGCDTTCDHPGAASLQEPMTVVVCTRDRDEPLATCLKQLQQLRYQAFEVLVVDSASSTAATRDCFMRMVGDDVRFRYLHEPVAGLSRARNRGLAAARTRYVAFTDDDVQVDPGWLENVVFGFARDPGVACVTGLVPPAELDHATQHYFDRRFSWSTRLDPRVYCLADRGGMSSLFPFSAGLFGTGANFAVDRELFQGLGGFDEALGAGSPAGGGEELDAFVRVLLAGRSIAYEPSAVVWHHHRSDRRELRGQLFRYGAGLTAFVTKYLCDRRTTWEVLRRAPAGIRQMSRAWTSAAIGLNAPATFVLAEVTGMAAGPAVYWRGRQRARRIPASA